MDWKAYLNDVFTVYRQEFNKFNEKEKTLVQLNITFSKPCQIDALEFLKPRCQALVVTFYDDFPDMDIVIHPEIAESPEQIVQELAETKEKWKRFNPQQLQNIAQAVRNCSKAKHWNWSPISDRSCVYTKSDLEELSSGEFVSRRVSEAIQQIKMKKRHKEMENVVPIPMDKIPKKDGEVQINFSLPFQVVEDGDYTVSLQGQTAKISIRIASTEEHFEKLTGFKIEKSGGGTVSLTGDTRGISVISQVEILLPYISDEIYFLQIALEYLNRLLDVWRVATGKFWLKESVSDGDIVSMNWEKRYPSGEKRKGMFAFGLPGQIKVSVRVKKTADALPQIIQYLIDETRIPLFQLLQLNAYNHYLERRFDLAIIEMNVALEDYTTRYIAKKLSDKSLSQREISRRLDKYDTFHKMLDRGFRDVVGQSLKENADLWKDFERMRIIRKNTIHPFVKKSSYQDATDVISTVFKIAKWISQIG